MNNNEIVQLKSYDDKTGQATGNVLPITNSEAVKVKNNKKLTEILTELDNKIDQTNASLDKHKNRIEEVATIGTTTEVLQITTESYIKKKIDDGTIANLTIKDNTITSSKYKQNSIIDNVLSEKVQSVLYCNSKFELGSLNVDGSLRTSTTRIRSLKTFYKKGTIIKLNDLNYSYSYGKYNKNDGTFVSSTSWTTKKTILQEDMYYIVLIRRNDNSDLTGFVDDTSEKITVYNVDSLVSEFTFNRDIKVNLTELTFADNNYEASDNWLKIKNNGAWNNAVYNFYALPKSFITVEFDAKATSDKSSRIYFGFEDYTSMNLKSGTFKHYRITLYNNTENANATIKFASYLGETEIKNFKITFREENDKNDCGVRFIAHRGISKFAPENTLSSMELAKKFGVYAVETDIRKTSDGVWVCIHDSTIDRTSNGTGKVNSLTYEQLLSYDFGSWKSSEYANEKIMSLEDFILFCKKNGIRGYIETKGVTTEEDSIEVINILKKYNMCNKDTTILSGNYDHCKWFNRNSNMKLRIAYSATITQNRIDLLKDFDNENIVFDSNYETMVDNTSTLSNTVLLCANNNIDIETWIVNDLNKVVELVDNGVTGICTDYIVLNKCSY